MMVVGLIYNCMDCKEENKHSLMSHMCCGTLAAILHAYHCQSAVIMILSAIFVP